MSPAPLRLRHRRGQHRFAPADSVCVCGRDPPSQELAWGKYEGGMRWAKSYADMGQRRDTGGRGDAHACACSAHTHTACRHRHHWLLRAAALSPPTLLAHSLRRRFRRWGVSAGFLGERSPPASALLLLAVGLMALLRVVLYEELQPDPCAACAERGYQCMLL